MNTIQSWGDTLRLLIELAGTAGFLLSGVLEGARKRLDAAGVRVVGFLAAFGCVLRDIVSKETLASPPGCAAWRCGVIGSCQPGEAGPGLATSIT